MQITPYSLTSYLTAQILTGETWQGPWTGSGTGFTFIFEKGTNQAPVMITNKHVLAGAEMIGLCVRKGDENGTPIPGPGENVTLHVSNFKIIEHPDPQVDLAAITLLPVAKVINEKLGWNPCFMGLSQSDVPTESQWTEFSALEEVTMVGYPTGIADSYNNLPITRRGVTATPPGFDYMGNAEFLIDMAVFPGSSGSPVLILNQGAYPVADGINFGNRVHLLGVLYAGHYQTVTGEIITKPIPTANVPFTEIQQMIHLGICAKSSRILELADEIPGWSDIPAEVATIGGTLE